MKRVALVLFALCALLVGCTTGGEAEPEQPYNNEVLEPAPLSIGAPGDLAIPSLNVASTLIPLGKTADGSHEVPAITAPEQAGWYEPGPEPGQPGPSIILGHVNGGGKPGVFADIGQMKSGDRITVGDLQFEVYEVQRVPKEGGFPADKVYAPVDYPELRLISCGGEWVGGEFGYEDNWIVYARKV